MLLLQDCIEPTSKCSSFQLVFNQFVAKPLKVFKVTDCTDLV